MDVNRKEIFKEVILGKKYVVIFLVVFILYFALNFYINQLYVTGETIFGYRTSFLIPFVFFLLLIPFLVALNVNLIFHKFEEIKNMSKKGSVGLGSMGIFGIFTGILGGACPGCFAGLFPAFLGIFGITASLSILPFNGLEIQALSAVLLLAGIYYLTNPVSCRI